MIAFPVDVSTFVAYQEQLVGRKLSEGERETTAAWVDGFNFAYEDGLRQDRAILDKDLVKLDELMARHGDHAGVHKFAEACRYWMIEAWEQGAERSRHEKSLDH